MSPSPTPARFSRTVRWGIIGCGDVCEIKSGPGFQKAADSELVAVMRRDAGKARDFAERHGVPRWYADADALIHDPGVDAIYLATPPGNHRDLALDVAAAGKPCYVEKPMARTHAECEEMNAAFAAAGQPLFVAYYRRGLPRFTTMKALLEEGAVGPLVSVSYRLANNAYLAVDPHHPPWRLVPEESGGSLLWDLGSHLIDLLDHLFGPLQEVTGHSRNVSKRLEVPDQTALAFVTGRGVPGTCRWDFANPEPADLLEIVGETGRISASCFGNEPLRVERAGNTEYLDRPNPAHVQQPLIQTMVDELLGRGGTCPSSGVSAARASRIIDAIGHADGR